MTDPNADLPIYRDIGCREGAHVWQWMNSSTAVGAEPEPWLYCLCGRYRWDEREAV